MNASHPPTVDLAAREIVAAVRTFVSEMMRDVLRMNMQDSEAAAGTYARACMENLPEHRLPALVAAHDALAFALNAA